MSKPSVAVQKAADLDKGTYGMRTSTEIQVELDELEEKLAPLVKRHINLERELRDVKSLEFIAANNITLNDVQLSSGEGIPYCYVVKEFTDWMKLRKCEKPFAEWNTQLHLTHELFAGKFKPTPARIGDVPE